MDEASLDLPGFGGTARFAIRRQLGSGGFGVVYEAYDRERHARVALKTLRQTEASSGQLLRFKREFRELAGLIHPHLVQLYELHGDESIWFFTMELIDGQDVESFVRYGAPAPDADVAPGAATVEVSGSGSRPPAPADPPFANAPTVGREGREDRGMPLASAPTQELARPPSPPAAAPSSSLSAASPSFLPAAFPATFPATLDEGRLRHVLAQIAAGLAFLHDSGRLHCDIKPSNVLVAHDGRVVLVDFGLVESLGLKQRTLVESKVAGTPAYMSPEQTVGEKLGPPSDWYSLGTVLYQLLTGRLPFEGPSRQMMADKLLRAPPPPSSFMPGLPADLVALCMELLERDPSRRPSGKAILERLQSAPAHPSPHRPAPTPHGGLHGGSPASSVFVGRAAELGALREALVEMRGGRPVVALVHGPSGMGKSALIERFLDEVQTTDETVWALGGRCYEQESVPYKAMDPVIDALAERLRACDDLERAALRPPDAPFLARLFPVLRAFAGPEMGSGPRPERRIEPTPEPVPELKLDPQELRRRGFAALRALFVRLAARRRLVLFIDDLQWGDADSGALLVELLAPPLAPALLLIASYRREDADRTPCLTALLPAVRLAAQAGGVALREVAVDPLPPEEARHLAAACLPKDVDAARAEAIVREAGGSPLFIDEMARFAQATAGASDTAARPASFEEVLHARVAGLPSSARRALELVAVAGRPLEREVLAAAAAFEAEELAVAALLRSGKLVHAKTVHGAEVLETYHDRIRESVVAALPEATRRAHHLALGRAAQGDERIDPEVVAYHFLQAGEVTIAAAQARVAAEQAAAALAFERAARLYRLALDLGGPAGTPEADAQALRLGLAHALAHAGRSTLAAAAFADAAAHAERAGGRAALDLRRRAAEQLLASGHIDEGIAAMRQLLAAVGLRMPSSKWQALAGLVRLRATVFLRGLGYREREAADLPADELLRIDTCGSVASGLAVVDTVLGAYFSTLHLLHALAAGEPRRVARALSIESVYAAGAGHPLPSRTEAHARAEARALMERCADPEGATLVEAHAGTAEFLRGAWARARQRLERAEQRMRSQSGEATWELDNVQHFVLAALGWLGEWKELGERLPGVLRSARERGRLYAETTIATAVGHLPHLAADRPAQARVEVRTAVDAWSRKGFHIQHYDALIALGDVALYEEAGCGAAAWQLVTEGWPALRRSLLLQVQAIRIEATHLRARALVAAAAWHGAETRKGRELLAQAARLARRLRGEEMAWATPLGVLVEALIARARGQATAERLLAEAATGFEAADMRLYAAAARRRRGQLLGGAAGAALCAQADAVFREQGVERPERAAAMLAPGVAPAPPQLTAGEEAGPRW
ncbi:MAG TPA: protein kinase [Polyangia bacterium]|nr:protein kinase [Polyangia bacterium]